MSTNRSFFVHPGVGPSRFRRAVSRAMRAARGFTLIEVLIAVVVLAIGLLGLGMVFPVVVRQQRVSQDLILGYSAAESAAVEALARGAGRDCAVTLDFNKTAFPTTLNITWKNPLPAWPAPDNLRSGTIANLPVPSFESAARVVQAALERDFTNLDAKGRARTVFGVGNVFVDRASNNANEKSLVVRFGGDLAQRDIDLSVKAGAIEIGKYLLTNAAKPLHSVTGVKGAMWDRALTYGTAVQSGERTVSTGWFDPTKVSGFNLNPSTGEMVISNPSDAGLGQVTLSVTERLSPRPFSGTPQFVSDFWMRRASETQMQVAVFTRRVDTGIRIPTGDGKTTSWTLSNVLTGEPTKSFPAAARRVPVAVDKSGRPTLTGADETGKPNYSAFRLAVLDTIKTQAIQNIPAYLDFPLGLPTSDPAAWQALKQPGQKLVDQFGGVNTVVRADETPGLTSARLILEAPISVELYQSILRLPGSGLPTQYVLYTPQVPAGVRVVTIDRP